MAFNLGLLKKHPYATGGIVIVGGIAAFYLLSSGGSSAAATSGGDSGIAAADATIQQANAAAAIQTNAQQVQLQTAQLNASVANTQTAAAVNTTNTTTFADLIAALSGNKTSLEVTESNNDTAALNNANQLTSEQNIYSLQESGIQHQYDLAAEENHDNNQTNLDALNDQLGYGALIQTTALGDATDLATQQNNLNASVLQYVTSTGLSNAPNKDNLNSETAIIQQVLAGGNPGVATSYQSATATGAVASAAEGASIASSISKGASSIVTGLFG